MKVASIFQSGTRLTESDGYLSGGYFSDGYGYGWGNGWGNGHGYRHDYRHGNYDNYSYHGNYGGCY
ncbi:MAG: hypothetical protein ACRDQX_07165 [Pseudonocardiaceae bacterium]